MEEHIIEEPTIEDVMEQEHNYGTVPATDGCTVEPDGYCEHGCPSWLIEWGMI